ncbi:MAG TPA: sulfite exporter TauE/SafE family protein [Devosia sp.]|nr:sulfite exporter TauE/SafE family protein [Devosia sp.]
MLDLSSLQLFYFVLAAALIGFTKTSVGGVGILAVLLLALAFPGKASPGIMLPMLVVADLMAVIYYRRDCQWHILLRIFPAAVVGIVIGFFIVDLLPAEVFERAIGAIILIMLFISLLLDYSRLKPKGGKFATAFVGLAAGAASMIANAAGPIFSIFLLQMGLTREKFVGTRSWYFLVLNIIKVPFSVNLGLITTDTLKLNLAAVPIILLGAFVGVKVLKLINMNMFKWLIRIAVIVAAVRLLVF